MHHVMIFNLDDGSMDKRRNKPVKKLARNPNLNHRVYIPQSITLYIY